jgi:phosphoribosylanthranilate isomerase
MRVRVKICGITSVADALQAADCGADAIGLNFYTRSPRHIDMATAVAIIQALPVFVEPISVIVNERLESAHQDLPTVTIQVHSDVHEVMPKSDIRRWIPAFSVKDEKSLIGITQHLLGQRAAGATLAAILVDASVPGLYGGTGQTAPWDMLANFKPGVPLILAGGLTPENVAEAIRIVKPYAVDVASGVESSPGKKDPHKMRRFIDAVRSAT